MSGAGATQLYFRKMIGQAQMHGTYYLSRCASSKVLPTSCFVGCRWSKIKQFRFFLYFDKMNTSIPKLIATPILMTK